MKEATLKVKLLRYTPAGEELIASAGKLCYSPVGIDEIEKNLDDEKVNDFVGRLMRMGHESPLEHMTFTFGIEGISRACSHQLVRHRIASYSQQSQRYVKENEFDYVVPKDIKECKEGIVKDGFVAYESPLVFYETVMEYNQRAYNMLVEALLVSYIKDYWRCEGVPEFKLAEDFSPVNRAKSIEYFKKQHSKAYSKLEKRAIENARYILPNACETKIIVTMNARELLHFFTLRCCRRAQDEIRNLADKMLEECKKVAPIIFAKAGSPCVRGKCPEGEMTCGKPRKIVGGKLV